MVSRDCTVMAEPHVNVAAMAHIVQDLVVGVDPRMGEEAWLHERAEAAELTQSERAALSALLARLDRGEVALLESVQLGPWY